MDRVPDDDGEIRARISDGAASCDTVLASGRVSWSDFGLLEGVLDACGDMEWM